MKISCIQMDMRLADPEYNYSHAEALIREAMANSPDVLVLPETWNTGFFPRETLTAYCDRNCEKTKQVIGALAKEFGVNIVAGSVSDVRDGKVYNTCCVFDRSGACIASYDKTHRFTPMGEDDFYEAGDHLCRFTLDGVSCAVIICYDIRFPELTRSLALPGLDVLFVVSQWPAVRTMHLQTLTRARAIENQMFLACCNSCGTAGETVYGGGSVILDPWGAELAQAGTNEQIITAKLDLSVLTQIRGSIPVFRDRRPELYR
ncbi:MAG: carbon-nitrogen family hydrolase [Oscillospiraceae bacterium]|nr:carbon-nitrogen family hydrolase [Oscillospiraceae bacterium]